MRVWGKVGGGAEGAESGGGGIEEGGGLTGKTNKPQARKEMGSSLRDTEKNYLSCARTKKKSLKKKERKGKKKKIFDDVESPSLPGRSGERKNICGGNNICRPIMDAYVTGAEREREVEGLVGVGSSLS